MPFYIGDHLADTLHLSAEQHGSYVLLLCHLWRCKTLPTSEAELARIARLAPAAWRRHRPVLSRFFRIQDGQWTHKRIDEERARAETRSATNRLRAHKAAVTRWQAAMAARAAALARPSAAAGPVTATAAVAAVAAAPVTAAAAAATSQWQEAAAAQPAVRRGLSAAAAAIPAAVPATATVPAAATVPATATVPTAAPVAGPARSAARPRAGIKRLSDSRHTVFRGLLSRYWQRANPASFEMPWEGRDARGLAEFLAASPSLGAEEFERLLANRASSAVPHGDRVYLWIANLTRYQEPLTRYHQPLSAGGGNESRAEINRSSVLQALDGALRVARRVAGGAGGAGAEPAGFAAPRLPFADGPGSRGRAVAMAGGSDRGVAARDPADGPAGRDGPFSHGATTTVTKRLTANGEWRP